MDNKLGTDFWILSCIVSFAAIIGIVSNPSNQSPWAKFVIGIILGVGLTCAVFATIILFRKSR